MLDHSEVVATYTHFVANRTSGRKAGKLTALTLPFSYPDGEAIEVYLRDLPDAAVTITDYGRTLSFLSQYGALDVRPKHVVAVVKDLCRRYEADFVNGEVQVRVSELEIGEGLCCITEAIEAVAGMIVLADVLHAGGGGGSRLVTRLRTRLRDAGLLKVAQRDPLRINGKSKVHDIRFAYPDRSTFILTQSLKTDPDDKARQVAFDSVDILQGYQERNAAEPALICVYQRPTDRKSLAKMPDVLRMLDAWFVHIFEVDADAAKLVKRISGDIEEISGPRLIENN